MRYIIGMINEIKTAYKAGQQAARKYNSITEAVYSDDYEPAYDRTESIAWEMGFAGKELREVTGWRYGNIPECGLSIDYRDNVYERGVSLMALDGDETVSQQAHVETMFCQDRPVVRVKGFFSGYGACGEPLVIGAEEI
jgi:hypothetical protein